MRSLTASPFLLSAFLLALAWAGQPAQASTFHVNRFDDPAPAPAACTSGQSCSLREAVLAANALPGADNLLLPAGDYSVSAAIEITDELDIAGFSRATTRIASGTNRRVFDLARGQFLFLHKLSLRSGGGVRTGAIGDGTAADTRLRLLDFGADPGGGPVPAIQAQGQLTGARLLLENSPFEGVFALDFQGSFIQLSDTELLNNAEGLRIVLDGPSARANLMRLRIDGGGAENSCGALNIRGEGQARIDNLEQRDFFSFGDPVVCLTGYLSGLQAEIRNSTMAENSTSDLLVDGNANVDIVNSTLGTHGLVARTSGSVNLLHTTIKGGFLQDFGPLHYANSVIEGSCSGFGPRTRAGRNVITSESCGINQSINPVVSNTLLGPLAYNGGNTRTYLPQPGSPAINAATINPSLCPPTDQRGYLRTAPCDLGAVESDGVDVIFLDGFGVG